MALSSAFHERLEQMESTRNQRLSLLQAEKELQAKKSQILASKLENIRALEKRCLVLDQKIASRNFKILALKSEIDNADEKYETLSQELRSLQGEVEELEEMDEKKDNFYETKRIEMKEFNENVEKFVGQCQMQVENLRRTVNGLKSTFMELKQNNRNSCDFEIATAEMRRSELLAAKENLDRSLVSNHQIKAQLQKQLHNILMTQTQERRKPSQIVCQMEFKQQTSDQSG